MLKHISYKCDVVATVLHKKAMVDATWFQAAGKMENLKRLLTEIHRGQTYADLKKTSDLFRAKLT